MPLPVLLALVVGGIAVIGLLLHLTGQSRRFVIDGEATARREWLRHYPEDRVATVLVAGNGRAALVDTDRGPGLLWAFGADTVAERLAAPQVADRPDGLRLVLNRFSAPAVHLTLTPAERALWRDRLIGARP